jgi:hypothetical protein
MERFLALHRLPERATDAHVRDLLRNLAIAAHRAGLRPVETFVAVGEGRAFTLFEAEEEAQVRDVCGSAGVQAPQVLRVERVHTELLDEPRRAR